MAASPGKQVTIAEQHFTCTQCGECCRRLRVHVPAEEVARVTGLEFPAAVDLPTGAARLTQHEGHAYLAHRDGHCVFLDPKSEGCLIHRHHGYAAKPLGCRVYPYNIASTFAGQVSVLGRFDCPAIRANTGEPLRRQSREIMEFVNQMQFNPGFDEETLDGLHPAIARAVLGAFFTHLLNHRELSTPAKLASLMIASHRLEVLGAPFLNETPLAEIWPSFFARVLKDLGERRGRRLGRIEQWRYLGVLSAYLRRDEELMGAGLGPRLARVRTIAGLFVGQGNLRRLGREHPDIALSGGQLFNTPIANAESVDWRPFMDLLRLRLQTWQFLGPTYYNQSLHHGLRALLLCFPLVIGAAKAAALARAAGGPCQLQPADLDYAVGAVDHAFGRSALLQRGLFTILVRQLGDPDTYFVLVNGLLNGQTT